MNETIFFKEKLFTLLWIGALTIVYLIVFPILFCISLMFSLFLYYGEANTVFDFFGYFILLLITLAIPFSIWFMWRGYFQMQYSRARFHCLVPIITLIVMCYFIQFLEPFNHV